MTLRLTGFSKKENKEVTLIMHDGYVWSKDDLCNYFDSDQVVQLREYNSGILVEEVKVDDIHSSG